MEVFVNIATLLTWCSLVLLRSLQLDRFYVSDFQISQHKHDKANDKSFRLGVERTRLQVFIDMKFTGLVLVFSLLLVWHRPGWAALLLGAVGLFLVFLLSTFKFFQNLSQKVLLLAYKPVLKIITSFAPLFSALHHKTQLPAFSDREELIHLIRHGRNKLSKSQTALAIRVLGLVDKRVREVMTKRSKIISVNVDDLLSPKLVDHLHVSGFSQFPVCQDSINSPVGTLVLADISDVKVLSHNPKVGSLMRPNLSFLNIDDDLEVALQAFIETSTEQFLVVDTDQKVCGLLTLADIFSEIYSENLDRQFDDIEATSEIGVVSEEPVD